MTFTVKTTKRNIHGVSRSVDPADYFVPGIGLPAKSTADYYNLNGTYGFCCGLDMDQCGAAGAAVKAENGGLRYPWLFSSNHPNFAYKWLEGVNFMLGFSNDPAIFPTSLRPVIPLDGTFNTPDYPSGNFQIYEQPFIIYNPYDTTGGPFWMHTEAGPNHYGALLTSPDFVTWTPLEISHPHLPLSSGGNSDWSSFQRIFDQTPGAWRSVGLFENRPTIVGARYGIWTSTDGIGPWTPPSVPIAGTQAENDADDRVCGAFNVFETGGSTYAILIENQTVSTHGVKIPQYISIVEVDPVTLDIPYPFTGVHIGALDYANYKSVSGDYVYGGPDYINDVRVLFEDGIAHTYVALGFASDVNTWGLLNGLGGMPWDPTTFGGGLIEEFIDYYAVIYDAAAAAQAAPCGVEASCNAGVVWINWDDTLPSNTYRLYRGDNADTQDTLIRDVTGTFTVDNPALDQMWYYKLVTLDSGTERKSRVVKTYVSSDSNLINKHRIRVIDDGGA